MVFINWLKPVVQKNHRISTEWIVLEIAEVPEWSMTWKERVLRIPLIEPGSKKKNVWDTSQLPKKHRKTREAWQNHKCENMSHEKVDEKSGTVIEKFHLSKLVCYNSLGMKSRSCLKKGLCGFFSVWKPAFESFLW